MKMSKTEYELELLAEKVFRGIYGEGTDGHILLVIRDGEVRKVRIERRLAHLSYPDDSEVG